jgi:alpha-beta hydrolase superfamily lysophospholipase
MVGRHFEVEGSGAARATSTAGASLAADPEEKPVAGRSVESAGLMPLSWLRRIPALMLAIAIGSFVSFAVILFFVQRGMIYFPRHYEPSYARGLPPRTLEVVYQTTNGRQVAFYIPPRMAAPADSQLWVVFSGNASVGLDWLDFVEEFPSTNTAFLLVDYPGYGLCEGRPSARGIRENVRRVMGALEAMADGPGEAFRGRVHALGYSIGASAALEFATMHETGRVVLIAPYTSLLAMARRTVGWPLCHLLLDRFDNVARMRELAGRRSHPAVHIFHGTADQVVPFAMGREVAAAGSPEKTWFHEVRGGDHDTVFHLAKPEIVQIMAAPNP